MEKEIQGVDIKRLLEKLRSITLAVQIAPFVYTVVYMAALVAYLFVSEETMELLDTMLYISPVAIICFLVFSRILELCNWHKAACIMPLIPQVSIIIDEHFYKFSSYMATVHLILLMAMLILLLTSAYFVFIKPKRNGRNRNSL